MAVLLRGIPQHELESVAQAGVDLVGIAKELKTLANEAEKVDPAISEGIQTQLVRLLDVAETVVTAARVAASTRVLEPSSGV